MTKIRAFPPGHGLLERVSNRLACIHAYHVVHCTSRQLLGISITLSSKEVAHFSIQSNIRKSSFFHPDKLRPLVDFRSKAFETTSRLKFLLIICLYGDPLVEITPLIPASIETT